MGLGEKILQLRKANGLSQEQLAEMLNVSRQAISKWETDQSAPEIEKVLLLSKTFSISTDELLGNQTCINSDIQASQLTNIVHSNIKKRQFTLGWITMIVGFVLLTIEYLSLRIIQFNAIKLELEYAAGTGFYSDPMKYAYIAPMPAIFTITVTIIVAGVALMIFGFFYRRK